MTASLPRLHLNLLLSANGTHHSAWRHPSGDARNALTLDNYIRSSQLAEEAAFDAVFVADRLAFEENPTAFLWSPLEPITLLSAVAAHTSRIGLIATVSTTFTDPYNVARMLSSLDHFSQGRAAWNIVTSYNPDAAANFGLTELPPREERYARAHEYLDVVGRLWDSWEDGAVVDDKAAGISVDPGGLHPIDHKGKAFAVAGPLNLPRSPQGRPVYIVAGASAQSRDLAGRLGEGVYTNLGTLDEAVAFTEDVKRRAAAYGRDPRHVKVMPGVIPYVGETEDEAHALRESLIELAVPEEALRSIGLVLGVELRDLGLDDPIPVDGIPEPAADTYPADLHVIDYVRRERPTVRDVLRRLDGYGHRVVIGSGEQIADDFEEWLTAGAADGFTVMPPLLPSGIASFARHVIPELRRRGLFRHAYEGPTLRHHYTLPRPSR